MVGRSAVAAAAEPVPVVLLSGFLGAGKTTLLKHWLENAEGRIGVVVNDVAAVNIDAKLVDSQEVSSSGAVDTVQLQNGCACCNMGDELLVSIYDMLQLATEDRPFSHIVVELSGVAEPERVKENFEQAAAMGSEVVDGVRLDKVVTLVDSSTFCTDYMEYKRLMERPDLVEDEASSAEAMEAKVVELLCEQVESADVVVLNKRDLASEEQLGATAAVIEALNENAALRRTSFGKVGLSELLVAQAPAKGHGESHAHKSDGHEGHGESNGHAHSHASDCKEASCSHESHGHDCHDPGCTDESHGHSHSHSQLHSYAAQTQTTAAERFGITSFCFEARRPFHADRLAEALQRWPVPKKDDLGDILATAPAEPAAADEAESPLSRVIRSKGFCWIDSHPSSKMFWSHAGKNMVLQYEGLWWGAMPSAQLKFMQSQGAADYERAQREDWDDEWADRRQQIVFIGQRLDEPGVRAVLDSCLLTDEEMVDYCKVQARDEKELASNWEDNLVQY